MNEQTLRRTLSDLPIPDLRYFDSIGSTNDEAMRWIEDGARDGSFITANMQTSGRGRLGRKWVTEPGVALAFSLILRPAPWEVERLGLLSPLGALAVSQALEQKYGLSPRIKWPNDVLLEGQKMCGILLEAAWVGDRLQGLVIGIGVNVLKGAVPPPDMLLFPATSLEHVLGRPVDREELLHVVLQSFFAWRERIASLEFLQAWESRLAYKGEWVRVEHAAAEPVTGQVMGVAASGNLRLQISGGEEVEVNAGDVRVRPVSSEE